MQINKQKKTARTN